MKQLVELSAATEQFLELGVSVAAMSYDSVDTNSAFARKYQIQFPVLSDVDHAHVKSFGILNTNHPPGHPWHGVPYPGVFVINRSGVVVEKFAEENYRSRPGLRDILEVVHEMTRQTPPDSSDDPGKTGAHRDQSNDN
ncbi:MAG: redoxin domain-containing protein [Proteobacteria bacterium]|nr:redoxin domain-containing protein [Pseudomonadota bacterium]